MAAPLRDSAAPKGIGLAATGIDPVRWRCIRRRCVARGRRSGGLPCPGLGICGAGRAAVTTIEPAPTLQEKVTATPFSLPSGRGGAAGNDPPRGTPPHLLGRVLGTTGMLPGAEGALERERVGTPPRRGAPLCGAHSATGISPISLAGAGRASFCAKNGNTSEGEAGAAFAQRVLEGNCGRRASRRSHACG